MASYIVEIPNRLIEPSNEILVFDKFGDTLAQRLKVEKIIFPTPEPQPKKEKEIKGHKIDISWEHDTIGKMGISIECLPNEIQWRELLEAFQKQFEMVGLYFQKG